MPLAGSAPPKNSRYIPWLALALILAILAGAIFMVMWHLRGLIIDHIASRDGDVLYAASKVQIDPELADDPELRPIAMENKAVEASLLLTNVFALRLFDSDGLPQFSFPENVRSAALTADELERARELQISSFFQNHAPLSAIFESLSEDRIVPLLRVLVPLESENQMIGVAEFLIDGRKVEAAFAALDRDLWRYGILIFVLGGGIIALSLGTAFGRLQKTNKLLANRTASLLKANHELTLAAKTSAVGAITAHLIHDLKSPLFGLQSFVAAKGSDAGAEAANDSDDWKLALSTTQRMQNMINDIVRILQEEKTGLYELTIEELLALLRDKVAPQTGGAGLRVLTKNEAPEIILANRDANIVLMVLTNLVHNACQATPRGGEIRVSAAKQGVDLIFEVSDTGPGLPGHVQETLFTPTRSTKSGGTGLGLAISKQLANHAGAELTLKHTSEKGTTFELKLPERIGAPVAELSSC